MTPNAITFIESVLINPETGQHFVLTGAECCFLRHAFALTPDGRLQHPELIFSAPKKSGKTAFAAMIVIYVVRVLGGPFAEGIIAANDFEQSVGRVFQAIRRIVEASPLLKGDAAITANKIEFASTGATIVAIASDYAGAAGANPTITCFDELWGYVSERSHRLWDELVPPPTRKIACRLTVTYAGYEEESELLEGLYKRGLLGEQVEPDLYEQPGLLMFWTHDFTAPWQTDDWREQMHQQLRPNAYLRLIENRWVSTESTFIDMDWWDECVDPAARPVIADLRLPVWVGVDASVKRDSTAIVAASWDDTIKKVRIVMHRIFQPSAVDPLDFESTVELTLLEMMKRFRVQEVRFDPYQMQAVAQRLLGQRVPMVEFPQSVPNLTEASTNLFELIKGRNLTAYDDHAVRLAVQRSVAIETTRGWRIAKEKASHKIDVVVALAMAALGAVQSFAASATPALWRRDQLLVDGAPVRLPEKCDRVFAVAIASEIGKVAIVYCIYNKQVGHPLILMDCDLEPQITPTLLNDVAANLVALTLSRRARNPWLLAASKVLVEVTTRRDYFVEAIEDLNDDLALAASAHIASGAVKVTSTILEKSRGQPLGARLGAKAADDDPLPLAAYASISVALDDPPRLKVRAA